MEVYVVSTFQSFTLMCIFHLADSIFKLSIEFTKMQLFLPALLILLWNYLWLYKINNVQDIFAEVKNLPKSKSDFYTIAIVIHIILSIGLFILAINFE